MGYNINHSHKSSIYGPLRFQWYITCAGVYSSFQETAWTKRCDEEEEEAEEAEVEEVEEDDELLDVFDVFLP